MSDTDTPPVQTTEPKKRKGRGPTVAKWQIVVQKDDASVGLLPDKFPTQESCLRKIESDRIENVRGLFLPVSAEVRLTAKIG